MTVAEVCNNKIYRVHSRDDDHAMNVMINLRQIYRRTNELTVYECINRNQEMPVQPAGRKDKTNMSSVSCDVSQFMIQKVFKSLTEIKMGTILDAKDDYVKLNMVIKFLIG